MITGYQQAPLATNQPLYQYLNRNYEKLVEEPAQANRSLVDARKMNVMTQSGMRAKEEMNN